MGTAFRTAIVTGGSRGIGAAAVSLLARNGWRVAVGCYQRLERANALCASLAADMETAGAAPCVLCEPDPLFGGKEHYRYQRGHRGGSL